MDNNKIKWHFRVRREAPLFPAFGVTESLARTDKALKFNFNYNNVRYVNYDWLLLMKEEKELEETLKKRLFENPNYYHDYLKRQKICGEALKEFVKKISSTKQKEDEMKKELHNYINKMLEFYSFWWLAVPSGRFLEEEVKKIMKIYGREEYFGDLVKSSETLELSKDQIGLLKIAKEIKGKKFEELNEVQKDRLNEHAEKFGWLSTTYHLGEPQNVNSLYEKAQKCEPEKEIKDIEDKEKRYDKIIRELRSKLTEKELEII